MQITIQIQNAVLDRLTQARSDDGVIDFDECIDLSDQGCNDALVVLQSYYQRKLKEDINRKKEISALSPADSNKLKTLQEAGEETATSTPELPASTSVSPTPLPVVPSSRSAPTPTERKKSGLLSRLSRAKSNNDETNQIATSVLPPQRMQTAPTGPHPSRASTGNIMARTSNGLQAAEAIRREAGRSTWAGSDPPSYDDHDRASTSLPRPGYPTSPRLRHSVTGYQKNDQQHASKDMNRHSFSSDHSHSCSSQLNLTRQGTWSPDMSRSSTLATIASKPSDPAAIAKYGGFCKYAYFTRDKGVNGNLVLQNTAMYTENYVYGCKSSRCKFSFQAKRIKGRWEFDTAIYTSQGIQYRLTFLAKSHVPQLENTHPRGFLCLLCSMLNHDSDIYLGIDSLFAHIATHRERQINSIPLDGPVSFSNHGVKVDDKFDLNLHSLPTPPLTPEAPGAEYEQPGAIEQVQAELERYHIDTNSKTESIVSDDSDRLAAPNDPYFNAWA